MILKLDEGILKIFPNVYYVVVCKLKRIDKIQYMTDKLKLLIYRNMIMPLNMNVCRAYTGVYLCNDQLFYFLIDQD